MESIHELLVRSGKTLSTAESCTGGNIAHTLTMNAGSSAYFIGSIVSYSNDVKQNVLGVSDAILNSVGAVSKEVSLKMSQGVKELMQTDYAISTTGIAGPGGGSEQKPVGTVWISVCGPEVHKTQKFLFRGSRNEVINQSTIAGLQLLEKELKKDLKFTEKM